jgi:hypothetical protein
MTIFATGLRLDPAPQFSKTEIGFSLFRPHFELSIGVLRFFTVPTLCHTKGEARA